MTDATRFDEGGAILGKIAPFKRKETVGLGRIRTLMALHDRNLLRDAEAGLYSKK